MKRTLALLLCLAMLLSYMPSMLFTASAAEGVIPEDGDISTEINPDDVVPETTAPAETEPEVTQPVETEPVETEPVETEPEATTEETTTAPVVVEREATCADCGREVIWQPVTGRINSVNGTHFYLTDDYAYVGSLPVISVAAGATVCVDLNGHKLTTNTEMNVKGELNIQGEGSVIGNIGGVFGNGSQTDIDFDDLLGAAQGGEAVAYDAALINIAAADAVVNIYGGTYSVSNEKPIVAYTEAGSLNLLGGKIDGTVSGDNLTLGGAAKVTLIETSKLTVKEDWIGSAVVNADVLVNGVAEGDFTGDLKTTKGRKVTNDNGTLKVVVLENNPVQEAALDMVFPTDGSDYVAMCPACGVEVTWQAVSSGRILKTNYNGDQTRSHFYLAKSYTVANNNSVANLYGAATDTMCIHLNGKTLNGHGGINAQRGILNIMGEGVVKTDGTCTGSDKEMLNTGVVLVNMSGAVVNLYGGNYRPYENTTYAVNFLKTGSLNIYEGVAIEGKVNAPMGSLNMEHGTIYGVQGDNIQWNFTDGDLTITGTGAMASGVEGTNVSWYAVNGSVKNFYIPAGVTGMDDSALQGTTILEAIHVDVENAVYSSADGILYDKAQTTLLMVPGNISGEITIPASVATIDEAAFFNTTQLTAINVDPANECYSSIDGVLFNKNQTELIRVPATMAGTYTVPETVTTIAPYAFAYCEGLTEIVVPDSVTEIGEYAFRNCILLESLILSKNITAVPDYMCAGCTVLATIEIPEGVTYIGTYAFSKAAIAEATIPASVTVIGKGAFRYCPLTDVYYGSTQEDWDAISYEPTVMSGFTDELVAATKHYTDDVVLTGITITAPTKIEYELGESLDLAGLVVTGTYSDETTAVITEGYEVTGFDSETAGAKTVTVTFEGFTATFEVTVKEPVVLTGITVTAPTKTEYELGEELNMEGLVVTGTYSDETTAVITEGYEVTGFDSETAGAKTVTVTFEGFTDTFEVIVKEAAPAVVMKGISVSTLPSKTTYMAGASFDAKGMVVTATYSDGTTAAITDYTVNVDLSTAGIKTVTVTCGEFTATFTVEVIANVDITVTVANAAKGIAVTWNSCGAEKYRVYARAEGGEWTQVTETTAVTYSHTAAVAGTKYEYKVVALTAGETVGEAVSVAITRVGATTITVANDMTGVRVTWDENAAATAYNVYRRAYNGSVAGEWVLIAEVTEAGYVDEKAVNGTKYGYMVRAVVGSDLAAEGTEVTVTYLAIVNIFTIENTSTTIRMTWRANPAAEKYFIYRSELNNGEWSAWTRIYSHTDLENLVYSDHRGVSNGVTYRYMIRALKGTQYSVEHSGTEQMRISLTTIAAENKITGVEISWKPNAAVEKYLVYRSEIVDGAWGPWGNPILEISDYSAYYNESDKKIHYTDLEPVNGQRYRYMVRTQCGEYKSAYKSGAALYRLEAPSVELENVNGAIKLTWTKNAAVNKYMIYVDVKQPGASKWDGWVYLGSGGNTLTTTTAAVANKITVVPGATYRFRVTANQGENQSAQVVTRQIVYVAYTLAPTVRATTDGITLTLKTNEQTNKFYIERCALDAETGTYGAWEYVGTAVNDAAYLDSTAVTGVTYKYRTRAMVGTELGAAKESAAVVAK